MMEDYTLHFIGRRARAAVAVTGLRAGELQAVVLSGLTGVVKTTLPQMRIPIGGLLTPFCDTFGDRDAEQTTAHSSGG